MEKPRDLIDREEEWGRLVSLWGSDRPELAFVLGRRRVGKSFLLTRFSEEAGGIYYQATRRTQAEQLARVTTIIAEHFDDPALRRVSFPDWERLLGYLAERAARSPLLVVLDEFPYLADAEPALPSILQAWWDDAAAGTRLKFILSGSHVTAMRRLEEVDQPLYGRRTARLSLRPFRPPHVRAFLPDASPRDLAVAFGIYGGLPGHLALMDARLDVGGNAAADLLDPSGRLVDGAQHMLDAFLGEAEIHYSILEAVAQGNRTWKAITSRLGKSSGSLSRPLRWLMDMDLVERVVPITETRPDRSKRAIYRIADPYVVFWHRFVSPLVSRGTIGLMPASEIWRKAVEPGLDDYMGEVFEAICRDFAATGGRMPFQPFRVGEWWSADGADQVDVVAVGERQDLLVGECKWGRVRVADLQRLVDRAGRLREKLGSRGRLHLALFTGREEFDPEVAHAAAAAGCLCFALPEVLGGSL